jgi:hypothetical protein
MDETEIVAFRERFRQELIERLVLKNAFAAPLLIGALSIEQCRNALKGWLDDNSSIADQSFGKHFHDPALTALYADEVKEIVNDLKKKIDKLATELETHKP